MGFPSSSHFALTLPPPEVVGLTLDPDEHFIQVGFVKLTDCRLISTYFHEAKSLKLHRTAIGDLLRFRIESG